MSRPQSIDTTFEVPWSIQGVIVRVGDQTMLREHTTHRLVDFAYLIRSRFADHLITIVVHDNGHYRSQRRDIPHA